VEGKQELMEEKVEDNLKNHKPGTSLKDPSYQDGVKREQEVQAQIAAEKTVELKKFHQMRKNKNLKQKILLKLKNKF
jgi:hypothetical protein